MRFKKDKKGMELAMNTIIVAVIALIVFVFMIFFIGDKFGMFGKTVNDCKTLKGECRTGDSCGFGTEIDGKCATDGQVCCLTECSMRGGICGSAPSGYETEAVKTLGCDKCYIPKSSTSSDTSDNNKKTN